MDLKLAEEYEEYRLKAREWLRQHVPRGWQKTLQHYDEFVNIQWEWEKALYEGGYAGISWPKEYGGQGLTMIEEIIFNEEKGFAKAPEGINHIGKSLFGPTLLAAGTDEQKRRFLPPLLAVEEVWCQGYSEPDAGSDLASLQTRAELDGDEWVINGQKTWTSNAQHAHWCFVLARTDFYAPKHKGMTYFLVPMDLPGITIRPIRQMNRQKKFNEVFFENVRIPKDSYVGKVNEGWNVAMTTLSFERGATVFGRQALYLAELFDLVNLGKSLQTSAADRPMIEDPFYRQQLSQSFVEFSILRYHALHTLSQILHRGRLGPEASLPKLYYSEAHQRFSRLAMDMEAHQSTYWGAQGLADGMFQQIYLDSRAETIYAGTSQIQKNILAERVLGLPR